MEPDARGYEHFRGRVGEFASESEPWWPPSPAKSRQAPNIVVVLVDDLGFSDFGVFGSEIDTPNIDRLAQDGWTFTNYHTAPMCSPSRASLLTGLNPHRAGFGYVAHIDPGYPGFSCELPSDAPTLAESLRAAGYATFMVGKWHLTLESKLHDAADKASWPTQRGFDRYYGSMDGFTSLHAPHRLISDNTAVEIEDFPDDYFLTDDLTDHALGMIDDLRANDADKPFLLYYAHTAVHGPIQAKPADIAKYRGRYDAGWHVLREQRFDRQVARGIVGSRAELPGDDLLDAAGIPMWDELSDDDRALFARHMEVYAAAVDEVDQSVGQIVARLSELGELDNTIIVITSDNGGTAEGGPSGTRSYFAQFGMSTPLPPDWVSDVPRDIDLIGGPRVFSQYPAGWARVSNTPFRSFKSSTYEGGVHAPLVMSWPAAPVPAAGVRRQFVFVSDLAPTLLDLAGVVALADREGRPARDIDGRSFARTLADAGAPPRRGQYIECVGRRALYADGVKILSIGQPTRQEGAGGGVWELYDLYADPTETHDIAVQHPDTVIRLAEHWRREAWRNTVFPLDDDGSLHRVRPVTEAPLSDPVALVPFRPPLERYRSAKLTVLRSFTVEVDLHLDRESAGVIVAHGDQGGGYLLAVEDGRLRVSYNAYGRMHRAVSASVPAGRHRLELALDEQPELHWRVSVAVGGEKVASVDRVPMLLGMAPFTGISVGYDYGSPVDWDLHERRGSFRFRNGDLHSVRYVPGHRSPFDTVVLRALDEAVALIAD